MTMYGKHFARMYEGSMQGAGPTVFAVWGYCIAKADPDAHTVLLNPVGLSGIIGTTQEDIGAAIEWLCEPDPRSKNKDHEGRRLLHEGGTQYFVVSHEHYRNMRNRADIRDYERDRKRKQRESKNVRDMSGTSGTSASVSASGSVSGKGESEGGKPKWEIPPELDDPRFREVWQEWIKHRSEIRKKLTPSTGRKQLKKLAGWGVERAINAIEHSIAGGWQGIFEPDGDTRRRKYDK